jgi:hypothetical protein
MNASEIAFGIEFETTLPAHDATPIGPYHAGYQVPWLPSGWRAEHDSSIQAAPDRKACEFVSPKLRGAEGLAQVEQAIDAINARGARVNPDRPSRRAPTWAPWRGIVGAAGNSADRLLMFFSRAGSVWATSPPTFGGPKCQPEENYPCVTELNSPMD